MVYTKTIENYVSGWKAGRGRGKVGHMARARAWSDYGPTNSHQLRTISTWQPTNAFLL